MAEGGIAKSWFRRRSLFGKYVVSFVAVVVLVLADERRPRDLVHLHRSDAILSSAQSEKAEAIGAAHRAIRCREIERQINWATRASATTLDQRRSDYALLLQQVPAVDRVIQLDAAGKEQLRADARGRSSSGADIDYSGNPRFKETQEKSVWFSPVYFDGPDPFMTIAIRHSGRNAGSTVAEINLKFLSSFSIRSRSARTAKPISSGRPGACWRIPTPMHRLGTTWPSFRRCRWSSATAPSGVILRTRSRRAFGFDGGGRHRTAELARLFRAAHEHGASSRSTICCSGPVGWWRPAFCSRCSPACCSRADGGPDPGLAGRRAATGSEQFRSPHRGQSRRTKSRTWRTISIAWRTSCRNPTAAWSRRSRNARAISSSRSASSRRSRRSAARSHRRSIVNSVLATIVTRAVELSTGRRRRDLQLRCVREVFELAEAHGVDQAFPGGDPRQSDRLDASVMGMSAQKRKPICIADLSSRAEVSAEGSDAARGFQLRPGRAAARPGRDPGRLVVQRRATGDFPASTVGLMQTFAHQSVVAMNNARLFREVDREGARACGRQRAQGSVFRQHEPRAAHAAQRHARLCRTA